MTDEVQLTAKLWKALKSDMTVMLGLSGVSEKEAERRAWATVNKETGGGNKSGSGRGVPDTNVSARKGGRIGGKKSAARPAAARSAAARKAAATRKRHEHHASR